MSLTTEIATLLTSQTSVYIGSIPATPDNIVAIFLTGGFPRDMSGTLVEEPTFQIRVRNASAATGETVCNTVKDLLHGKSSAAVLMIQQQGDILSLGRDEKNRSEWSMNFRCYYRR
ncbi:MAG: minor capsid protein [Candidatus Paceibacterota bacterium]|jgi:hypothetical protein